MGSGSPDGGAGMVPRRGLCDIATGHRPQTKQGIRGDDASLWAFLSCSSEGLLLLTLLVFVIHSTITKGGDGRCKRSRRKATSPPSGARRQHVEGGSELVPLQAIPRPSARNLSTQTKSVFKCMSQTKNLLMGGIVHPEPETVSARSTVESPCCPQTSLFPASPET